MPSKFAKEIKFAKVIARNNILIRTQKIDFYFWAVFYKIIRLR